MKINRLLDVKPLILFPYFFRFLFMLGKFTGLNGMLRAAPKDPRAWSRG